MSIENMSPETTPEISMETTTDVETTSQVLDQTDVEPEFTPNYKYKAYGKEYEVDEWARPLINKDNQEHLIKLYEKSGGFDHLKTNFKDLEQRHSQTEQTYSQLENVRQAILQNIDRGDLGKAFNIIGLKDDQIMNYVKQKLEYSQLPADQRAIVDQYRQTIESKHEMETELQSTRRESQELQQQRHEFEIEKTFNDTKYAPAISDYNTRVGDPNAFRNVIQQIGLNEWHTNNVHIPVAEATERAMRMLALNPAQAMQMSQQVSDINHMAMTTPSQPSAPAPKPIMRVGKGGGLAPIKQRPMRVSDLENEYKQLTAQN